MKGMNAMHEVKKPKKPLIFYYLIVMLALMLFNSLLMPLIAGQRVVEVDYGTFMDMTVDKDIGLVQVESCLLYTSRCV